jgi:uncharacterized protein (DUF488 family)
MGPSIGKLRRASEAAQRPLKLPSKSARARAENKALWNEARSPETADFFTFGYEGRPIDELLCTLRDAGVRCVLDIRYNPVSMYRPELSKANLQKSVDSTGLQYFHLREWGVPREVRALAVDTGTRDPIWEWYDQNVVAPNFGRNLHRFLNLDHPVAMMCMECDPTECHRHRLFIALERQGLRGYDL